MLPIKTTSNCSALDLKLVDHADRHLPKLSSSPAHDCLGLRVALPCGFEDFQDQWGFERIAIKVNPFNQVVQVLGPGVIQENLG